MPRDYVKSRSRQPERSAPSGAIWLLLGVLIGLIIAGIFYVKNQKKHPQPLVLPAAASSEKITGNEAVPTSQQKQTKTTPKTASAQNLQTQFDFYNVLPSKKIIGPSGDEDTAEIQNQNAANAAAANTPVQNNSPAAVPAGPTAVSEPPQTPAVPESKIKPQQSPAVKPAPQKLAPVLQAVPAPMPKAVVVPPRASSAKASAYIVQVAALSNASDADQLKAQLTLLGFNVNVSSIEKNGKTLHRVWLGTFPNKSEAESAHKQLHENMISSQVLKSGS